MARQMASPSPTPGVAVSFSPRVNFSKTAVRLVIALRQEHVDRVMRAITQAVEIHEAAR